MATTLADARKRIALIAPDSYERILGWASLALLAAVLVALARGYSTWGQVPAVVWPHLLTIMVVLVLTPIMMFRRRGDARHRLLGKIWVVLMIVTALASFRIQLIERGSFSWIHLLAVWTLIQAPLIWWTARHHQVARHRSAVRGMTTGALLIAGFFTFPFNRLLGQWLFG